MSQENVERTGGQAAVLVHYRVFGGPVGVDQRLTVFEDGGVKLDERHRKRAPIWLRVDPAELDGLRSALEGLPSKRWSRPARLALTKLSLFAPRFVHLKTSPSDTRFLVRRGRRAIIGQKT